VVTRVFDVGRVPCTVATILDRVEVTTAGCI